MFAHPLMTLAVAIACLLFGYSQRSWRVAVAMLAVQALACASVRPQIQAARDDFVLACRALTAAMVGDGAPSKAERIAQKVCLAERMGETIEHEIVKETGGTDLFTDDPPETLAPVPIAPEAPPSAQ